MPQDAFHIRRLAKELNAALVGGKINRISQVSKDELTFIIYTGKTTVKLILSANATGARVCISETEKPPLAVAPNFCMLLRKHLQNAEILSVKQYAHERIIEIELHCTTDFSQSTRVLRCELMGKYSNIVLTEKDVVLGALKTTALMDDNHRVLLAGARYEYPAPQDKLSPWEGACMRSRLCEWIQARDGDVDGEALAGFVFENVAGFALPTARELVKRAIRRAGSVSACLSEYAETPLWQFVGEFFEKEPCAPCVKRGGDGYADFSLYTSKETKKGFEDKKRKLESAVRGLKKKAQKRLQDALERLKEAEKAEENRIKGELLTANLYRIERGMKAVELENWYDEKGGVIRIALDETLSPSKNAQKYFKAYNKQKRAKEILTPMRAKEEAEVDYADSVFAAIRAAESDEDLKEIETELIEAGLMKAPAKRINGKKKETEVPFREYEHGGMKIYLGRNNLQNDRLLRWADGEDIWLHTQKYHSSHAIIATEGKQVQEETVLFAAELCAYYSDGRTGDKIPVDHCKRKHVKKPKGSKAGFVTYTDYKTVLVTPNPHKE